MQLRLQIIIAIVLLLILIYIIQKIKSRKLEIKYALSWFAVIAVLLLFDLCPFIMTWLSEITGIATPSNWLFALGFVFFILIVLSITVVVSSLVMQNKTLVQEVGMLKRRVEILEKQAEENTVDKLEKEDSDKQ